VYFGVKNNVSSFHLANFHTKLSQHTHLFSCHLFQCSYKHTTINKKEGKIKVIGGE